MNTITGVDRKTASVEEAAQMLGIGRSATYRLVRTGELRSVRIGSRFVIPLEAIDELLAPSPSTAPEAPTAPSAPAPADPLGALALLMGSSGVESGLVDMILNVLIDLSEQERDSGPALYRFVNVLRVARGWSWVKLGQEVKGQMADGRYAEHANNARGEWSRKGLEAAQAAESLNVPTVDLYSLAEVLGFGDLD